MKSSANTLLLLEAKDARIKELEDWKDSAMTVLGQWHDLVKSLPKDFLSDPKILGKSEPAVVIAYINAIEDFGKDPS